MRFRTSFRSFSTGTPLRKPQKLKAATLVLGTATLGTAAYCYSDEERRHYPAAFLRSVRSVTTTTSILSDYAWTLKFRSHFLEYKDDTEYKAAKSACHSRSAQKLLDLCLSNGYVMYIGCLSMNPFTGEYISNWVNTFQPLSTCCPRNTLKQ